MPIHKVEAPNGRIYTVETPEGASKDAIIDFVYERYLQDEAKRNKTASQDIVTSGGIGLRNIPSAITGALDLVTYPVTKGIQSLFDLKQQPSVSRGWDEIGALTGIQPSKTAKEMRYQYSPELEAQKQTQQAAFDQPGLAGLAAGAKETITSPRLLGTMLGETLPATLVGGPLASKLRLPAVAGEGIMAGGQAAAQLSEDGELSGKEAL